MNEDQFSEIKSTRYECVSYQCPCYFIVLQYSAWITATCWKVSSNVNEVIRAVLNFFFFYEKILHTPKAPNAQRRNQAKAQNATSEQK